MNIRLEENGEEKEQIVFHFFGIKCSILVTRVSQRGVDIFFNRLDLTPEKKVPPERSTRDLGKGGSAGFFEGDVLAFYFTLYVSALFVLRKTNRVAYNIIVIFILISCRTEISESSPGHNYDNLLQISVFPYVCVLRNSMACAGMADY